MTNRIQIGQIVAPHGIQGFVKINAWLEDPRAMTSYGPIYDKDGHVMNLTIKHIAQNQVVAAVQGVTDRNTSETLRGTTLYIDRDRLPELTGNEYYAHDLIGMNVIDASGVIVGKVLDVMNFGAGDILDIQLANNQTILVMMTKQSVPTVDLSSKTIHVVFPFIVEGDNA